MKTYLCLNIQIDESNRAAWLAKLEELAIWALRLTPLVGLDSELLAAKLSNKLDRLSALYFGLILDLTGTKRFHGGYVALIAQLEKDLEHLGICARLALGPTIGSAWALSRFNSHSPSIVNWRNIRSSLEPLPIQALRLESETLNALHAVGIYQIEQLLHLPIKELGRRFGLKLINRIDAALGRVVEAFNPVHAPERIYAEQQFEIPLTTHKSLSLVLLRLLESVTKKLNLLNKTALSLRVQLHGLDECGSRKSIERELALNAASKSQKHLECILQPLIESLHFESGITGLRIEVTSTCLAIPDQADFLGEHQNSTGLNSAHELMNNLISRLGQSGTRHLTLQASHLPEKSFQYVPIKTGHANKLKEENESTARLPLYDYPPYLLAEPENIMWLSVLPSQSPAPIRIQWQGRTYRIIKALGPERISAEWWHKHINHSLTTERDYYSVLDDSGLWLWIFLDHSKKKWFVHGIWA